MRQLGLIPCEEGLARLDDRQTETAHARCAIVAHVLPLHELAGKGKDNMIITPDTLKALFIGFKKNFQDGLKMAESQYKEIATVIPSSTASNTYGWLGQWPAFREWVGDRVFQDMKAHGYAITNKHFEARSRSTVTTSKTTTSAFTRR